ncbi:uncharacterized protein LOC113305236 [Papaver somniferum]|uniref:uncharacterized protein LOC113305236 n=1 Tax=Papaver somniferum TaxID=3469 RepID=UPI000E6FB390|nr:uncharacterized protein LOC113305236 [Papaver somniferum]
MVSSISFWVFFTFDVKRRSRIRVWLSVNKPDIIVFQESLLPSCNDAIVRSIWGPGCMDWRALDSIVRSGGILIIWNPNKLMLENYIIGSYTVNIQFKNCFDNFVWLLSGAYGPCSAVERRVMWRELKLMYNIWELPWCLCGDFNEVRYMRERMGCNIVSRGMKDFNKFCGFLELIDLPMTGGKYTWSTTSNNSAKSLIDRFIINAAWGSQFPTISVSALAKPFSDHKPVCLTCNFEDWGPPSFRCEAMWFLDPSFLPLLEEWWNSFSLNGSPGFVLAKKLQALKAKIKIWNKEVFGNIERKCEKTLLEISSLDQLGDDDVLSTSQVLDRKSKKFEFEKLADMKHLHWLGKSRMNWHLDGGRNTKFFHRITKMRRRRNTFAKLKVNNVWIEDKQIIKDSIVSHFQERFKCDEDYSMDLSGMQLNSISEEDKIWLEKEFTEIEVLSALKKLGQDRAPGPDGFQAISKLLAERLKTLLHKLVSSHQSAFVKGRQILDSVLIANECLDSRINSKIPGLVCKIDLEKAFDNVKWSFVDEVLKRMGFGEVWRKWIAGCIKQVPFSVLVNGSCCGKFSSQKGLRQGDLLSPFIFLLVSEVLTSMFTKAAEVGWIGGFQVRSNGTRVSHLQFADDTLVFLDADISQVRMLKYNLLLFEYASGLKTNFGKSNIFAVGNVENIEMLASVFGCAIAAFPAIYLGLPLGDKALSCNKWERVVEMCYNRLAIWKSRYLSKAGSRLGSTNLLAYKATNAGFSWDLGLTHGRFNDAEINELSIIFRKLDSIVFHPIPDEDDSMVWLGDNSGSFTVNSAYQVVVQDPTSPYFPHKLIWSRAWPHKVAFFLWQCVLNRLPITDNLQERNVSTSGNVIVNL